MARKRKGNPVHGWINFDKPLEMGSTQAVGKVRWLFSAQKAGHAGTLDPLATGVLPIALGDATKTVPFLVDAAKEYIATIKWGERTDTLDAEGEVVATSDVRPTAVEIEVVFPNFIGQVDQIPPKYSALKIDGKRAYDLARSGVEVEMKSRTIRIDSLELIRADKNSAVIRVRCGKGTYIRSLARDLAIALGTEGSLSALRRTRVGPFIAPDEVPLSVQNGDEMPIKSGENHADESLAQTQASTGRLNAAFSLDALEEIGHKTSVLDALLSVETALDDIPVLAITEDQQMDLKLGRAITVLPEDFARLRTGFQPRMIGELDAGRYVLAMYGDKAVALCDARAGRLSPKRVFNL